MKKISDEMFFLVFFSGVLFVFILVAYFPHPFMPEDYSYEDFSPLDGLAIADEMAAEVNPDAILILVQKGESYEYRYNGFGEWWWKYYYQNISDPLNYSFSYFIVTLYQNQTSSILPGHGFPYHETVYNPNYPLEKGIENWTVDCDEALEIARKDETFADFNRRAPGLDIISMELYPERASRTDNPMWHIDFEGNYDDGFDGMYGTSGYVEIDATTGEVIYVWVGAGRHAPPICVLLIIIVAIVDVLIAVKLVKKMRSDKKIQT